MRIYRLTLTIDDEIPAETLPDAWQEAKNRVELGYYGPTVHQLEDIGEAPKEE